MVDTGKVRPGVLHIVATPIGNLEDISRRTARVLSEVDLVAAEDSRRAQSLLSQLGVRRPVESYHEHSDARKRDMLLARLHQGQAVALITDAGVPTVSDPGADLVARREVVRMLLVLLARRVVHDLP